MGQSRGGGYMKMDTLTPEVKSFVDELIKMSGPNYQQASQGFSQFLPGGGGGKPIIEQANKNFQQQSIPSILNALGTGSKTSSALNQALAAGASNLNTDLASQLAQMQLQASQGVGNLATGQANIGTQTPQFAFLQKQQPFWQSLLFGGLNAAGNLGGAYLGAPRF
jgi:hypothetical protein